MIKEPDNEVYQRVSYEVLHAIEEIYTLFEKEGKSEYLRTLPRMLLTQGITNLCRKKTLEEVLVYLEDLEKKVALGSIDKLPEHKPYTDA